MSLEKLLAGIREEIEAIEMIQRNWRKGEREDTEERESYELLDDEEYIISSLPKEKARKNRDDDDDFSF